MKRLPWRPSQLRLPLLRRPLWSITGLKGSFSYKLDWTPYLPQPQAPGGANQAMPAVPFDPSSFLPAISTALQEQLGLKLESGKGPVDILVIDRLEKPSEN